MFPLAFSLILSVLFGLAAYSTYGTNVFTQSCWIELVMSSLIALGFIVSLLGELNDCLPCRLKSRFTNAHWLGKVCSNMPCIKQRLDTIIHH
jgi:hypothetical protein